MLSMAERDIVECGHGAFKSRKRHQHPAVDRVPIVVRDTWTRHISLIEKIPICGEGLETR